MSTLAKKPASAKKPGAKKAAKKIDLFNDPALLAARKKLWVDPTYDFTKPTLPVE